MMDRSKVNVEVCDVEPFANNKYKGFTLTWSGNIGFGEYTIYQNADDPDKWKADSEHMDTTEDKWFLKLLMEDFINKLEVTE